MKKIVRLKEQSGETSIEELYDSLGNVLELATALCSDYENEEFYTLDPHVALDCLQEIDSDEAHHLIALIKFYEGEIDSMEAEEYYDEDEFMGESKVIKLKESDLHRIVKKVLNQQ